MASVTFNAPGGSDPVRHILDITNAILPTVGDALYGAAIAHSAIRTRTEAGQDVDGVNFAPYSEGYAKRKAKQLGHADTVDLFGPDAHTHMLNAIVFKGGGLEQALDNSNASVNLEPINYFEIGIYGDEATRAQAHNEGLGNMPRRHFFDVNADDITAMERGMASLQESRAKAIAGSL
jgi:hypothetical protein